MRRNRAFDVVEAFEEELAAYTGARYCVTTDSCTNALYLALLQSWDGEFWQIDTVSLPKHTYVGVVHAARNAGLRVAWRDEEWEGSYRLFPFPVVDSAKKFQRDMYVPGTLTCLSFQAGKQLPIGRGGAILTDNQEAAEWLRAARLDGRTPGRDYADNTYQGFGAHCYLTPPDAARGLWLLTYIDDDDKCDWTEYPDLSQATWT